MKPVFNNRDPVYLQVVRYFKERIATGDLQAGDEVPSRREMAGMLNINPNTAQKAYKEMEDQGLIFTERNVPSKITSDQSFLNNVRNELIMEAVESFIESIRPIQVPVGELLEIIQKRYTETGGRGMQKHD
ncbi:GntR family transcriptional regulator [Bacillus mangrovi]|uniref:GntR family transcriptional regulator n=1 Tax=Metabacillus mangrovi TaxID=1491830 RepID=A0A7X2S6X6_9BACI|nr:GntR family transcriptional regulator [Metabacillus mangrovi]MTH54789.1 GntR family transcriptional regulator [Metabacillus mangrovi]